MIKMTRSSWKRSENGYGKENQDPMSLDDQRAYQHQRLDDILIPGYLEKDSDYLLFKPMYCWVFLRLGDGTILECYSNDGDIKLRALETVRCPFELEEGDAFCLTSYASGEDYAVMTALGTCRYDKNNLIALTIQTTTMTIGLQAATSVDGFEISLIPHA